MDCLRRFLLDCRSLIGCHAYANLWIFFLKSKKLLTFMSIDIKITPVMPKKGYNRGEVFVRQEITNVNMAI